jgi:hypothetical protein
MHFGEYLRAIVTADADLVPDDALRYRVAFVEAFKKRGIFVPGCISMAPDSLLWEEPDLAQVPDRNPDWLSTRLADMLSTLQLGIEFIGSGKQNWHVPGIDARQRRRNLRDLTMRIALHNQLHVHRWLAERPEEHKVWGPLLGLQLPGMRADADADGGPAQPLLASITADSDGCPKFEVHSARIARRQGPNGETLNQLVVQIAQRRRAYLSAADQDLADSGALRSANPDKWTHPDFWFRGGTTFLLDLRDGRLRRVIRRKIDNADRLAEQRAFLGGDAIAAEVSSTGRTTHEPFALVHRSLA